MSSAQIGAAQYFTNAATSRTRGVDLVSTCQLDLGQAGALRLSASGNYNKTRLLDVADTPQVLEAYAPGIQLYGRASKGLLTESTPRTKYVLGGTWLIDSWSLSTGLTRYGSIMRVGNTAAAD